MMLKIQILNHYVEMEEDHMKQTLRVNSQEYFLDRILFFFLDQAAENNGTHGMPVEDFQKIILDQHNNYRRAMCANNLENDEDLHRIAETRAHSRANENEPPIPDDYNENIFESDTGDPSKITGIEKFL